MPVNSSHKITKYPTYALSDIKNPTFISFLDLSRWLAAAVVFIGHLRAPLFLGYSDVPVLDQTILVKLWYFVTGLHMEAVIVFFVLSGYLVGGISCAKINSGRYRPDVFAIDRVTRLYVAFLPAVFLTYFLDMAGSYFFGEVGFWNHSHPMIVQKANTLFSFDSNLSIQTLLGNIGMLQGFAVRPVGSNQPFWTISMEFWFYIFFGLIAAAWITSGNLKKVLVIGASLMLVLLLGNMFLLYMGIWFIGVLLAFIPSYIRMYSSFTLFIFLLVLALVRLNHDMINHDVSYRMAKNYIVAISFGLLLVSMRNKSTFFLLKMAKINRSLADFSYSLYLIHFPLMIFLLAGIFATGAFHEISQGYVPTNGEGVILYVGIIIVVYSLAWLFSRATEAQTWRLRKYLKRKLISRLQ